MHDNVIGRHNNIHVYGKFYTYFDTYFFFYVLCITFVRLIKDEKKKILYFPSIHFILIYISTLMQIDIYRLIFILFEFVYLLVLEKCNI